MDEPIVSNTVTKTDVCGSSQTEKPRRRMGDEEIEKLAFLQSNLWDKSTKAGRLLMESFARIRNLIRGIKP